MDSGFRRNDIFYYSAMDINLFDYTLPPDLIAQEPARKRDESRLMIVDRQKPGYVIHPFRRVMEYLEPGDAMVVNDTKVFKARLYAYRKTGAKIEVFLVRPAVGVEGEVWVALVSPTKRLSEGEDLLFDEDRVTLAEYQGEGRWLVQFQSRTARDRIVARHGHVPLPHYIKRDDLPNDIRRYQTVFAGSDRLGAVAAPTAGFHFTRSLLGSIRERGIEVIRVTLHVGPGTFKPVSAGTIEEHVVDAEFAELSVSAAAEINAVRAKGGRIVAVGTTSVRTLESAATERGRVEPLSRMVDLYIKPGYQFKVVDRMITNFHLPKSSLLILVSAFAGRERILEAYRYAVEQRMRFYSYGDAMLIV